MINYKIAIEEHITETFEVVADSVEEAVRVTIKKYKNGEFVLEPGNVTYKCMAIQEPEVTEWLEF